MSKDNAWMPLYVGDYLADTMHLSGPEHGAYLLLLMHSWRVGPLPDDDRQLARIAQTDATPWKRMAPTVRAFFTACNGRLLQARLERVRAQQEGKTEQRRAAGKASAEARSAQRESNARSTTVEVLLPPRTRDLELDKKEKKELPSQPSVGRSPRGSRLPPDWNPDLELRTFATDLGLAPDAVAANFRDYWHAKPGKEAVKLDWPATWRGWCRREAERNPTRPGQRAAIAKPHALDGWLAMGSDPHPNFDIDAKAEEVFP